MNKRIKRNLGAMITGTLMTGALVGANSASAAELFTYDDLGSGSELREELLNASASPFMSTEAKCGEGKCGEGKCGGSDKKKEEKDPD